MNRRLDPMGSAVAELARGILELMQGETERYRAMNEAEYVYRSAKSHYEGKIAELQTMCRAIEALDTKIEPPAGMSAKSLKEVRDRCAKEADKERRRPQPVAEAAFAEELHDRQTAGRSVVRT